MDEIRCNAVLFLLASFISILTAVSGLECHSCNSLGIGESHSNDACKFGDKSQLDKTPCQAGSGEVVKCQTFTGTVTVDLPLLDPQTAEGTYRGCATFKSNAVPQDECFAATEIPNDAVSTVFQITSFLGADETINGQTCYCSGNNCNANGEAEVGNRVGGNTNGEAETGNRVGAGTTPKSEAASVMKTNYMNLVLVISLCITFIFNLY